MNSQNRSKINKLLQSWPTGTVAVYAWLKSQGIYRQLADLYVKSGWLERVGRGAFKRAGEVVTWEGALYAIQEQLHLSVHVAGKTSLEMQGYAHYLPLAANRTVALMGNQREKLPLWFTQYSWNAKIKYIMTGLFGKESDLGLTDFTVGSYSVKISSPERAMLEVCYSVPDHESFDEARLLMEGLATLRPDLVQNLLEKCNSVKTKRLFMYFAEHQNHAWVKKIDLKKVDFGEGNRMLCKHGHYDKKYRIVVPGEEKVA